MANNAQGALALEIPSASTFKFHDHPVRIVMRDGEPWFVCTDVANSLGYRNAPDAARNLAGHQKGTHSLRTPGGEQAVTIISESGLYRLVLRSRKPEAVAFSDWVTGEILPAIRKTGHYEAASKTKQAPVAQLLLTLRADGRVEVTKRGPVEQLLQSPALRGVLSLPSPTVHPAQVHERLAAHIAELGAMIDRRLLPGLIEAAAKRLAV